MGKRKDDNTGQWVNICKEHATFYEKLDLFGGHERDVALYIVGEANVINWLGTIRIPATIHTVKDNRVSWEFGRGERRDAYFKLGSRNFVGRSFGSVDLITQLVELKG